MYNLRIKKIKNPRQQRAIEVLLEKVVPVKDLGPMIGAINPRQAISELRRQGFEGIIKTRRYSVIDRDGKRCRPGEYYIPQDLKPMVEKVLREHIAQASTRRLEAIKNTNNANDSREG